MVTVEFIYIYIFFFNFTFESRYVENNIFFPRDFGFS